MQVERFKELWTRETHEMARLMFHKNRIYAGDADVLKNIKESGADIERPSREAWYHLVKKHLDAVRKWAGGAEIDVSENLRDIANYCIMAIALIEDEKEQTKYFSRTGD